MAVGPTAPLAPQMRTGGLQRRSVGRVASFTSWALSLLVAGGLAVAVRGHAGHGHIGHTHRTDLSTGKGG